MFSLYNEAGLPDVDQVKYILLETAASESNASLNNTIDVLEIVSAF